MASGRDPLLSTFASNLGPLACSWIRSPVLTSRAISWHIRARRWSIAGPTWPSTTSPRAWRLCGRPWPKNVPSLLVTEKTLDQAPVPLEEMAVRKSYHVTANFLDLVERQLPSLIIQSKPLSRKRGRRRRYNILRRKPRYLDIPCEGTTRRTQLWSYITRSEA